MFHDEVESKSVGTSFESEVVEETIGDTRRESLLRQALLADAVLAGATALLLLAGAGFLSDLLALPDALLRYSGLFLMVFVAFVAYVATRKPLPRARIWAVILINEVWAAASFLLLLSGWVAPNALGVAFVLLQALVVSVLAGIQYIGIRTGARVPESRTPTTRPIG